MNNKQAKKLSNYLKEDIKRIIKDGEFLLLRIEEAEKKYKINKTKTKAL